MTCARCKPYIGQGQRVLAPHVVADEPRCAFTSGGKFRSDDNWDCQTLAILRAHPFAVETGSEDQTILVVPFDGEFVVLGFYKHRGHVETAIHIDEAAHSLLTLATVERLLTEGRGAPFRREAR